MNKIKQFFKEATILFHIVFIFISFISIVVIAWLIIDINQILGIVLLIFSIVFAIINAYYATNKIAQKYIKKYENNN